MPSSASIPHAKRQHIDHGTPPSQKEQKNKAASISQPNKVPHKQVPAQVTTQRANPDSSESLTSVHATHPSNRVGGIGRNQLRKHPGDGLG